MQLRWKTIYTATLCHDSNNLITEIKDLETPILLIKIIKLKKENGEEFPLIYGIYHGYVADLRFMEGVLTYGENIIETPETIIKWTLRIKARFIIRGYIRIIIRQKINE